MADADIRINVPLIDSLVKKHFGSHFTSLLTYSTVRGCYEPSPLPRRIAAPQTLFGVRLWWTVLGEFSENLGFRLELWNPAYLAAARALVEEYNRHALAAPLVLAHATSAAAVRGLTPA
ncbi:MAG TPA: hypothetical protein VMD08_13360 [Candidatus Baltobacteraceae bacterium]|nr:hypothetical protein [Candidatus Baltobacteraceae bacterium]